MGFLKPKAPTSSSSNQAFGQLNTAYSPIVAEGNKSTNFIGDLLGVNSGGSAEDAFANYKKLAGYAPALSDLQSGVTQGAAAQGLLNSGITSKRLVQEGQKLDQGMFGNFMQQLAGLSGLGQQAGQIISGAGNTSTNTGGSPSTLGSVASAIGGIASIFSDRRVKRDIVKLDEFPDGLGVYSFRYFGDDTVRCGVMADEVEKIRPWALGPRVGGFATVNYGAL